MRPLSDRVEGIDSVLRPALERVEVTDDAAAALRVAAAAQIRVHGDLLDYLADGGQQALLVADGIVDDWPDDVEMCSLGPRHGVELVPVARRVLAELGDDAPAAVSAATQVLPLLRLAVAGRVVDGTCVDGLCVDHFTAAVTLEMLEVLTFTYVISS